MLADIAAFDGVQEAADSAREAVDALLWDRSVRPKLASLAAWSAQRGAWASAAIDGAEIPWESVQSGAIEDSPMGEQVQRSLSLQGSLRPLIAVHERSPMQTWAKLNTIAATGRTGQDAIGRPRSNDMAEDPLRLGPVPPAVETSQRLVALATILTTPTQAPALVAAAVEHAELAVLRPFAVGSGAVARASTRLTLAARGLDPDMVTVPESGILTLGRAKYVNALRGFAKASPDGVGGWVAWFCQAVQIGAEQAHRTGQQLPAE